MPREVRLRTLLATIFDSGLIEEGQHDVTKFFKAEVICKVSKANCLALAQSAGVRPIYLRAYQPLLSRG